MREPIQCSFCRNKFDPPSAVCPHCGGPVPDAGAEKIGWVSSASSQNDDVIELDPGEIEASFAPTPGEEQELFGDLGFKTPHESAAPVRPPPRGRTSRS